jgi:peptidoglycan LD-endopeptidase LytH
MPRPLRRPSAALVGAMVLLLVALPAGAQSDLSSAREELAEARARVAAAQDRADAATTAYGEAETRLAQVELEVERLEAAVAAGESEVSAMREDLRAAALDRYLRASETPTVLSGAADLTAAVRADALESFATGRNSDVLDRFRYVTAELDVDRRQADQRRAEQEAALAELAEVNQRIADELDSLGREQQRVQALVGRLEEEERRRAAAEEARRRAEAEARAATSTTSTTVARTPTTARPGVTTTVGPSAGTGPAAPTTTTRPTTTTAAPRVVTPTAPIATGSWVCPVQGPTSFSDTWGAPRSGGRRHQGVDMMAATGTPVVAPVSGTVTHRDNSIGGLSFHLQGSDGNYYYGTHLSAYGNNGSVQAGTVVGYVGATGNATTPHLHFEIHIGGRGNAVNPYPTVRAAC